MAAKILIGPSSFADIDKTPLGRLQTAGFEIIENPYRRKLTKPELLALLDDPSLGKRLGEGAQQRILEHLTWEPLAEQIEGAYGA